MTAFLEKFFGASWRTSLFACIAVACTALAGCDLSPMVDKIAMAGAAVSTAIGLFLARDNKVSSSQVLGDTARNGSLKFILLLLVPVMMSGGCNRLVKWDAAHDKHVRATYTDLNRSYALCQAGDANECSMCVGMAAAETKYIKAGLEDANKPVVMDADFKSKFLILNAQLNKFNALCLAGDPKACRDGARHGVNGIGVVLNAVDDVNSSVRWK